MSKFAQLIPTPTYCLLYLKEAFEFARGHGQPRVRDAVLEKNLVELVPLEQVVVEFETVNIQKVQIRAMVVARVRFKSDQNCTYNSCSSITCSPSSSGFRFVLQLSKMSSISFSVRAMFNCCISFANSDRVSVPDESLSAIWNWSRR